MYKFVLDVFIYQSSLLLSRARPHKCPGMHRSLRLIVQIYKSW
jgi:hypothetical protein